jgi:transcriptional regulator with XRE-family HTH domain
MTKEVGLKLNKIKGLMAENDITQEKLADIIGLSRASIQLKLQGKRQFKADEIGKIARYFDVEVDFLYS